MAWLNLAEDIAELFSDIRVPVRVPGVSRSEADLPIRRPFALEARFGFCDTCGAQFQLRTARNRTCSSECSYRRFLKVKQAAYVPAMRAKAKTTTYWWNTIRTNPDLLARKRAADARYRAKLRAQKRQ